MGGGGGGWWVVGGGWWVVLPPAGGVSLQEEGRWGDAGGTLEEAPTVAVASAAAAVAVRGAVVCITLQACSVYA